jgi:hypothetical protein
VPLFRRAVRTPPPQFTVGVHDHRVVTGTAPGGVAMLDELRGYVAAVTGGAAAPRPDGRDSVAVLSAKMDHAELVNDAASAVALALEELSERGLVASSEAPPQPELTALPQRADTYEYIQVTHARALTRLRWIEAVDEALRRHGVGVLPPLPKEEPQVRLR